MEPLNPKILSDEALALLNDYTPMPKIILSNSKILYCDANAQKLLSDLSVFDLVKLFHHSSKPERRVVMLMNRRLEKVYIDVIGETVQYQGQRAVLVQIVDQIRESGSEDDATRLMRLRDLMLEINQSILEIDDTHFLLRLILTNALKAIGNASLGSIFVKEGDDFEVVAYIGFDQEIESFHLPIKDAFLYRSTDGKMDRIVNISNILVDEHFYPIKTFAGDRVYIKSELSAPIYINNELYGMMNVDSLHSNAFDDADFRSMEFILSSIQIAITNQLSFKEKMKFAMHDQLTTLHNRHYFNEQFTIIKEKALRYQETFNLILFDADDLKVINDTFGHLIGDQSLKRLAEELQRNTRKSDIIARYGGDEFIGICFASNQADLIRKFEEIERNLNDDTWIIEGKSVAFGFSFGISNFPLDGTNLADLVKVADRRMYEHKRQKKTDESVRKS